MYTRDEFGGYMYPDNAFQKDIGHGPFNRSMKLWGGGKGGGAPDPNPGMIASAGAAKETADTQREIAKNSLDFYKEQWETMKPIYQEIVDSEIAIGKANQTRADEYADYERQTFRPLEKQMVKDAQEFNTEAKREQLATQAAGDVSQAFGVAKGTLGRQMASAGLRPDSGRFAALNQNLLTQEALAKAGVQTKARADAEGLGYARLQDAANMGRGLASNASTAYGVSINANNAAGANLQSSMGAMNQGYNTAISANNGAANAYGTAGNIYGQEFSGRMQGYQANQAAQGGMWKGLGSLAGGVLSGGTGSIGGALASKFLAADGGEARSALRGYESGGPVKGPGGPVDDKIPAMLSDGEYVIPADTVKAIGKAKLDKLVKATHTPAAVQRGLKGKK